MAGNVRGNRTLTGSWGEVWVDGEKIFVLQKIEQKVEVNREDVQMGMNVDSKMTGLKGSGTLSIKKGKGCLGKAKCRPGCPLPDHCKAEGPGCRGRPDRTLEHG